MQIAICILAKDEANTVAHLLNQLGRQSLLARNDLKTEIHVVANGCTDDTAAKAVQAAPILAGTNAQLKVHDLEVGGKSRSWNRAVHELVDPQADLLLFIDSDITFCNDTVLEQLLRKLQDSPAASACSGYPVKDIFAKADKSLIDQFSLAVSRQSWGANVINGSLYIVRSEALRDIWLPDQTPGEDGFLNAMLTTVGFTRAPVPNRVIGLPEPTHFYKAHRAADFLLHERRMIVATMINCWIFEHLWSLGLKQPAGPLICDWNRTRPDWVDKMVRQNTAGRIWVISKDIMLGRFQLRLQEPLWRLPLRLAYGALATLLTVPPAIAANRRLKQVGAASTW